MVAEGRFAPLPSLVLFWRFLDSEVSVDSIQNINNMTSGPVSYTHLTLPTNRVRLTSAYFSRLYAGVVELADTRDLKSLGSNTVPVRARSPAPILLASFNVNFSYTKYPWHSRLREK